MSCWLVQSNPISLESPSESNDEDDDVEGISDEDVESESQSECSKEYDDDDFDNKSLEIDEEERHKISAQINPDEEEEDDDTEEEEKEEIIEKEDSGQEKNQDEHEEQASPSHSSLCNDSSDDDPDQAQATAAGQDDGETSMTESAESRQLDAYGHIQKLESERKHLLQELETDEQLRQYFYNKLKIITQKMESLHQTENHSVQTDIARRQLEMEAYKVQEAMQEKLGLRQESKLKQEARLDRIRSIEMEIISLQKKTKKSLTRMKDTTASTVIAQDVIRNHPEHEEGVGGFASERKEASNGKSATLSTQTSEVTFVKVPDGMAPGIPLSSNHLVTYNGAWPTLTRRSGVLSTLSTSQELDSLSFNSTNSSSSFCAKPGTSESSTLSLASEAGEQPQQLGTKVEMVYSLMSMLGTHDKEDMSRTLLAMSQSQDNCIAMRQAGCLPLLLQLLHGSDKDSGLLGKTRGSKTARARASAVLHNIVHCHHDDKRGRREARTLRLLEQIRAHCDQQSEDSDDHCDEVVGSSRTEMDHHPGAAIAALMKLSFDEDYRHAICTLGGLQAIAELLEIDNRTITPMNDYSTMIRRYSCMALTNLTFGDGKNKALLCSMRGAMESLTDQLRSTNEDLIQAAASVLRNLSWRADLASKKTLREIGVVTTLMKAAMSVKKETTLKSILSALWNLSSHCSENKAEICAVEGALQFLVGLLTYKSTAKTLAIIENGGGILRNISSQIAIREDYRQILRKQDCLKILLFHLKSPSLTIVSNACGTLWNLSARCEEDQNVLRDMGAISMLKNLVHSRHKMISSGSCAALKNLLSSVPAGKSMDNDRSAGSPRPSLHVRKLRALEAELDHNLSETCENVDSPRNSPTEIVHRSESEPRRFVYHLNGGGGGSTDGHRQEEDTRKYMTRRQLMPRNGIENVNNFETTSSGRVPRAGSQDSVGSTHSDISHDRTRSHSMLARSSLLLHKRQGSSLDRKQQQTGAHSGMTQPNHPYSIMLDYKAHTDQNALGNSSITMVNDIPAYMSQPSPGNLYYQLHQHSKGWQTMPNNYTAQHIHETADLSGNIHGQTSLTQSAPSHCQAFHHQHVTNSQHQQSLLERLAKSSSGLSGSCNLNNSMTVANNSLNSSMDYSSHLTLSSTADKETDQPVNYSLKHQDGATGERSNKLLANSSMHLSYDHLTSSGTATNFISATFGEPMKLDLMNASMNERNFMMNNSTVHGKVPTNNRQAANVSGNNIMLNSAVLTSHRPVPNLVHNCFHTPQVYQLTGVLHHPSQFISPQASCVSNDPFHSVGYNYSRHPVQTSNQGLPSFTAVRSSGHASQGKIFNTSADQFNSAQATQQNTSNMYPLHQFSGSTEIDSTVDEPTDFNVHNSEVSEENCSETCQEQPINYSIHFHDNERSESQEIEAYKYKRYYKQDKYAEVTCSNEESDTNSNEEEMQTCCTEEPSYLSAVTSFPSSTLTGKPERQGEKIKMEGKNSDDTVNSATITTSKMSTDVKKPGSRTEVSIPGSISYGQTIDRHMNAAASISSRDHNKCAFNQTQIYHEEETSMCSSTASSISSQSSTETSENDAQLRLNSRSEKVELACVEADEMPMAMDMSTTEIKGTVTRSIISGSRLRQIHPDQGFKGDGELTPVSFDEISQVEEAPVMFDSSSSSDSLSSCESESIHKSVTNKHSHRSSEALPTMEIVDMSLESVQLTPRQTCSLIGSRNDILVTPKSRNVVTKQSLNFDKMPSTVKSESFVSFAAFDEGNKPINFATKSQELPLLHSFPRLHVGETADFSCYSRDQEQPQLTFSTFQKNFQLPNLNQSNHFTNRLCTPRAKTLPTLTEQTAETETSAIGSDVPGFYTEEEIPPSQSGSILTTSSRVADFKASHLHNQAQKGSLPKVEEKEYEPQSFQKFEPHSGACGTKDTTDRMWSPITGQHKQEDENFPESEVPEEDNLLQHIISIMPTLSSADKIGQNTSSNTIKKRSGIPMKTSPGTQSKFSAKGSLIPKPSPKKLASSLVRSQSDEAKSSNSSLCDDNLVQVVEPDVTKGNYERQFGKSGDSHKIACNDGSKENNDSNVSSLNDRAMDLATVLPSHDSVPTDTTTKHNMESTSKNTAQSFNDTTDDSELSEADSACISRIPKAGKGLGSHTLPAKSMSYKYTDSRHDAGSSRNETAEYETSPYPSSDFSHVYDIHEKPVLFYLNDSPSSLEDEKDSESLGNVISAISHKDQRCDQVYQTEDMPDRLSRNSSLNSINGIYRVEQLESSSTEDLKKLAVHSGIAAKSDLKYSSSYDSFSEELGDYNPISVEQTVQEQCENSPQPKSRLPRGLDRAMRHLRTNFLGQTGGEIENGYIGNGLTKSVSLEMTNDYNSSSDTDHGLQSSSSNDQSSSENLMTQSCSDTTDLDLNFQISPFLSRQVRCSTWCHQRQHYKLNGGSTDNDQVNDSFIGDISPEETEKLLTENVNLIMSVIQTTKMNGSSVDDDLFIENETISLVSHGYTSDTNSEISVTWSVKSDKTSDLSSATLAGNKIQASSSTRRGGPKFIKPGTAQHLVKKAVSENSEVKSVRGHRKLLYPGRPNNIATTARNNIKIVASCGNRAVNVLAGNKPVAQIGTVKSDAGRSVLGVKKTPLKNSNVAQISPKTAPTQISNTKNKTPPQKIIVRRSRSAGPATTLGKNATSPPLATGTNKAGSKGMTVAQPQNNRSNLVKTAAKVGRGAGGKANPSTSTSVSLPGTGMSPDQSRFSTGASVSTSQSRIPAGSSTSPSQSKLPYASWGNKNTNNLTVFNNKKNNKFGGPATRSASSSALSRTAVEKRSGQSVSKIPSAALSNVTTNKRSSDTGIPRRQSSGSSSSLNNTDSNKYNSPGSRGSDKRISPINTEIGKRTSPVITDANRSPPAGKIDSNKRASPGNTNTNNRNSPINADLNKRTSPNNTDFNKRNTLNNMDANKCTPAGNTDLNKRTSPNNKDPNKGTPTGVLGRNQASSKIATLWKKDRNLDRSPSQGSQLSSASSSASKLPISLTKSSPANTKPSKLPSQGFKTKAATLPNSSLASSKSRTYSDRISKSSTYEKISSELLEHDTKAIVRGIETVKKTADSAKYVKQRRDDSDSSDSTEVHRGIFDSFDDDAEDDINVSLKTNIINQSGANVQTDSSEDPDDSSESVFEDSAHHDDVKGNLSCASNTVDSLEQKEDISIHIDSRTFRKKKRDFCISDLDLPNADETCRSTCSFNGSFGIPLINSTSVGSYKSSLSVDSIIKGMSIIDILNSEMSESSEKKSKHEEERSGGKTKSIVAQGLKRLFSGRHKEKELKEKCSSKESIKARHSEKESKARHSEKESKARHSEKESKAKHFKSNNKERRSGRDKREYDFFRSNIKIEPSTTWSVEDSLEYDLETSTVPPIRQIPLRIDPFHSAHTAAMTNISNQPDVTVKREPQGDVNDGDCSSLEIHMTKTEMLLARRRRTNLLSSQSDDGHGELNVPTAHVVTAV